MAAPQNIDFVKGRDFAFIGTLDPIELNAHVDEATPFEEADVLEGKGLNVATKDTALNTPEVPDATIVPKWKRYIWLRRPHPTATSTTPVLYIWNENAASDAIYLKWKEVGNAIDLQAQIDALASTVVSLDTTVEGQVAQISAITALATEASNAAQAATLAVESTIPDLQNRVTATENKNFTQDTAITAAQTKADQAYAAAFDVTDAQLNDIQDWTDKQISLMRQSPSDYTVTEGASTSFVHTFAGHVPRLIRWVLVCTVAANGYSIDDEIELCSVIAYEASSSISRPIFAMFANTTTLGFVMHPSSNQYILNKTTGAREDIAMTGGTVITNYKLRCYYSY